MEKNLKVICWVIILIILTSAPFTYFFLIKPHKDKSTYYKNESENYKTEIDYYKEKLWKAVETLERAKKKTEDQSEKIKNYETAIAKKDEEIEEVKKSIVEKSVDSIIAVEQEGLECPECICETKTSWSFEEKIKLETINKVYNLWLWEPWKSYILWKSVPNLEELYKNWDESLKSILKNYCWSEFYKEWEYSDRQKEIVLWYKRALCKNEENCPEEVSKKIADLKSWKISNSIWIEVTTKYTDWNPKEYSEKVIAYYDDFWKKICVIREKANNWKKSYSAL